MMKKSILELLLFSFLMTGCENTFTTDSNADITGDVLEIK